MKMNKLLSYMALPALLFVSCNKVLELDEVEAGFAAKGALPEVSIDASTIEVDEYAQTVTLDVTFSGVTADMDSLELGLLSGQDAGFTESSVTLLETPADGTYRMSVHVAAGVTNYVKAMAATTDGSVYSDRITVDVPDIPWYYKIAEEYVGTFEPDAQSAEEYDPFENHAIRIELPDEINGDEGTVPVTVYDADPYIENNVDGYVSGEMNYVTGELNLETRALTLDASGSLVDAHATDAQGYDLYLVPIADGEGYTIGESFVIQFSEDATTLTYPRYCVSYVDGENVMIHIAYSEDGVTLSAN